MEELFREKQEKKITKLSDLDFRDEPSRRPIEEQNMARIPRKLRDGFGSNKRQKPRWKKIKKKDKNTGIETISYIPID